jgi:two-component system chemotaxis sensor kinase CheA
MVPIEATFRKMIRLARDVAAKQGKQVTLRIVGEETEVDKTVAEVIADPLVHLLRNGVDHGLETPSERIAAGKPAEGVVELSARHVGGEVWIQVRDDGRGIDRDRVRAKAVSRGLVDAARAETLTDAEVYAFVFEPGFSTAAAVTDISGRGVGMDVVKRQIETVKGRVDVASSPGLGTTFTLRIPLTLAIIEGMLVRVGDASFTIPLLNIRESVVPRSRDVTVLSDGQEVVRIRGQLIPVVRLHSFYQIPPQHEQLEKGILVVVEDGGQAVCLFVDELVGQRQTVIKGLSGYLGDVRGLSGCTVLGDGRISLILDVLGLLAAVARAS